MRIVDLKAFLALPPGTIYAKIPQPVVVGPMSIKGDTIDAVNFTYRQIAEWDSGGTSDWLDRYAQMDEGGASAPCDVVGYGRDGMYEKAARFLIFERADLHHLRAAVDAALALPEMPPPAYTLKLWDETQKTPAG